MTQFDLERTIVAVSSGLSPARRAIVRLSGGGTAALLRALITPSQAADACNAEQLLSATQATSCLLPCATGWQGRTCRCRIYFWPDRRSFTGEPAAEIHLVGSLPLVESLVERLLTLGASPAERGEFTLRSFLAGKVDLTQAEAVLGVIEADQPRELAWALEQLAGNLSRPVGQLREKLVTLIAHLEAGLDFVEEDIEFISDAALQSELELIAVQLQTLVQQLDTRGARNRTPQVVLLGLPNAGKSSLFNALLERERAIITAEAGTTRDALAELLHLDDIVIELIDTAGVEELQEQSPRGLAQTVLQQRIERADAVLLCVDVSALPDATWIQQQCARLTASRTPHMLVATKRDRLTSDWQSPATQLAADISVSCRDPQSINQLRSALRRLLADRLEHSHSEAMHHTMLRCHASFERALAAIEQALKLIEEQAGEELVASELRFALDDLSAVIGEVHSDDILGEIFSRFCIGK